MTFDLAYALQILPRLLEGALVTIQATLGGMAFAVIGGLLLVIARLSRFAIVRYPAAFFVEFVRSTPLVIQLFLVFYVFPRYGVVLSPFVAGVLALGLHYSCYTSEVYRAGIAAVPKGQWEAAVALNFSLSRTWLRIILPQAVRSSVPVLGNYLIAMFKETPVLFTISVHELLFAALSEATQSYRYYEPITLVGLIFLVISLVSSVAVRRLEKLARD
ncbi:ectoine/hydroxyectoine ABC transporter permease subunit EhuD [Mesorhizobium sp. Root172]|jgi:polar amino acid transport system permease protein|uniref:ectoine/hydroxyectoine ABC transporter permease subunit EhuD n=1 Tax=Mesorhizobium sp. Root172 TaxID=1736481 RepID=UPI0006F21000|nr:ectoine/hydroxyectoine ABC transporter permease subunit EhuD [Mesorhizobium sp. Root172]KRB29678.1 ectoine/hydroxyectoine ABC transporter permease subunit EhuD [Mesorhizobium sp. Root172]